jgi:hypothetical protein
MANPPAQTSVLASTGEDEAACTSGTHIGRASLLVGLWLVLVAWILAVGSTGEGHVDTVLFGVLLLLWAAGVIIAMPVALFYGLTAFSRRGAVAFAPVGALALTLLLGLGSVPVAQHVAGLVAASRREPVAKRLIAEAGRKHWTGQREIALSPAEQSTSDGGKVIVATDKNGASVLFWDFQGILSGSASVYAPDPHASALPGGDYFNMTLSHVSGHWWSAVEEE